MDESSTQLVLNEQHLPPGLERGFRELMQVRRLTHSPRSGWPRAEAAHLAEQRGWVDCRTSLLRSLNSFRASGRTSWRTREAVCCPVELEPPELLLKLLNPFLPQDLLASCWLLTKGSANPLPLFPLIASRV